MTPEREDLLRRCADALRHQRETAARVRRRALLVGALAAPLCAAAFALVFALVRALFP